MSTPTRTTESFVGSSGNILVADRVGTEGDPVLLLHGGGQTRHAWAGTAAKLAAEGRVAYLLDQRGHGDSDWSENGDYRHVAFAADLAQVVEEIHARHGMAPIAIGASFGGLIGLLTQGLAAKAGKPAPFRALVFVDITLRTDEEGANRIRGFMRAHSHTGFATVDEAADAIGAYMTHRPRPSNLTGLQKNLRRRPDGRWRWHWDPRFMDGDMAIDSDREAVDDDLVGAAANLKVPTLLIRGGSSELVQEHHAREFLELAKGAEYADVRGARHMVAGDANDQFTATLMTFLTKAAPSHAPA